MSSFTAEELQKVMNSLRDGVPLEEINLKGYIISEEFLRKTITGFRHLLVDPERSSTQLIGLFVEPKPHPIESSAVLPPKFRVKSQIIDGQSFNHSFPILPRVVGQKRPIFSKEFSGEIGILAAVIHPDIGSPKFCKVLSHKTINGSRFFLVAFLNKGQSPCYVSGENLYELKSINVPSDIQHAATQSVDSLLGPLYGKGQNTVRQALPVLLPRYLVKAYSPSDEVREKIKTQCIAYSAILYLLDLCANYTIPEDKYVLIIDTLLKVAAVRYPSTKAITDRIVVILKTLYSISRQRKQE